MSIHDSILKTRRPIHNAAKTSSTVTALVLFVLRHRDEAMAALPIPMPRMNEIRTIANDCKDEPEVGPSNGRRALPGPSRCRR